MQDNLIVKGYVKVVINDTETKQQRVYEFPNLVVLVGRSFIASRMVGTTSAVMSHMAVGLSGTAPIAGDTTLGSEAARVALSDATVLDNVVTYSATFPAGTGTGSLVEAGIFNDGSAGTMLTHTIFTAINKGAADEMIVTWTVSIGA